MNCPFCCPEGTKYRRFVGHVFGNFRVHVFFHFFGIFLGQFLDMTCTSHWVEEEHVPEIIVLFLAQLLFWPIWAGLHESQNQEPRKTTRNSDGIEQIITVFINHDQINIDIYQLSKHTIDLETKNNLEETLLVGQPPPSHISSLEGFLPRLFNLKHLQQGDSH